MRFVFIFSFFKFVFEGEPTVAQTYLEHTIKPRLALNLQFSCLSRVGIISVHYCAWFKLLRDSSSSCLCEFCLPLLTALEIKTEGQVLHSGFCLQYFSVVKSRNRTIKLS